MTGIARPGIEIRTISFREKIKAPGHEQCESAQVLTACSGVLSVRPPRSTATVTSVSGLNTGQPTAERSGARLSAKFLLHLYSPWIGFITMFRSCWKIWGSPIRMKLGFRACAVFEVKDVSKQTFQVPS